MATAEKNKVVQSGKVVDIKYTLRFADGQVVESTEEGETMPYLHGTGAIPVGLESALGGRAVGDQFSVTLQPADAYGEYDEEAVDQIPLDAFPDGTELAEGDEIFFLADDGEEVGATIENIDEKEGSILVNYNHPFAGETVTFDVEVVGVRDATPEELEHGHAHDPSMQETLEGDDADDEEWDDEDDEDWDDEDWDDDDDWDEDDEDWEDEEDDADEA